MLDYNKYYARNEEDNEQYSLKSYWTSSNTVEFNNEQTLEQYKTSLENQLNGKCDSIEYDIDDGKLYLYSNDIELDNEDLRIRTKPNIELGDIENFSIRLSNGRARICWSDPLDVEFASLKIIEWAGTKIVRKIGSAPENPTDGTVILDSQNRDEYNNVPFFDTIQTDTCYYYRLFPYDTEGNYYGKTCGVIYSPTVYTIIPIPTVDGTYTYTGQQQEASFINYDASKMTMAGNNTGTNADTYEVIFTLEEGYKWNDGTLTPKTVSWTINKAVISSVPSQSNTLTYTGNSLTPTWDNYDSTKLTIAGDTSGINAGNYVASFTPTSNYMWSNNDTTSKTATWVINKANGYITLSPERNVISQGEDNTMTITSSSGAVSVSSSDSSVATFSVETTTNPSRTYIDCSYISDGDVTMTIVVAATDNTLGYTYQRSMVCTHTPIYGIKFSVAASSTSSFKGERTQDAAGLSDPVPYKYSSTAGSSPFDEISPWKDIEIIEDPVAGTMVKIPKYYYRIICEYRTLEIQITTKPLSGFMVSPAHSDRGDGKGERDYVYVGAYYSNSKSNFKSASGTSLSGATRYTGIENIRNACKDSTNGIYMEDGQMYFTYIFLLLVEMGTMKGDISYTDQSNVSVTGSSDASVYHTAISVGSYMKKYRGIEGFNAYYDNKIKDGFYGDDSGNIYVMKNPATYSEDTIGSLVGNINLTNGQYTTNYSLTNNNMFPIIANETYNTGYPYRIGAIYNSFSSGSGKRYYPNCGSTNANLYINIGADATGTYTRQTTYRIMRLP